MAKKPKLNNQNRQPNILHYPNENHHEVGKRLAAKYFDDQLHYTSHSNTTWPNLSKLGSVNLHILILWSSQ